MWYVDELMYRIIQSLNQDIFASYSNLKSQALPDISLADLGNLGEMKAVKEFTMCNPSVTDLSFYSLDNANAINFLTWRTGSS